MNPQKYPFIRIFIPYAVGIVLWENFKPYGLHYWVGGLTVFFSFALILNYLFNRSYHFRWVSGLIVFMLFFAVGLFNTGSRSVHFVAGHLAHDTTAYDYYYGRITEPAVVKEKSVKLELELIAVRSQDGLLEKKAKVMVYLAREDSRKLPEYGQIIRFLKAPSAIEGPLNPYQFDYRAYLARKGIFHQVYLQADEWDIEGMGARNPLYTTAFGLRDFLLRALQQNHIEGDTYGVAAAILLGYDESLPAYLRKGYTAAGAMHVLCVSGLHVGIVFLFFNFLFGLLFKRRKKETLKTFLLLLTIWFYALLTGLSPSVQRAAIMLSFVLLARIFKRKGYVMNSIFASAFIILIFDPFVLYNIGFQLSYLAVAGIVLLHRPVYGLLYFKNKYLDKVWEISAVALSAQLMTTPLVLHYFSQFPTYFLVSNLVLVPVSFVVIVSGMVFLLLSFVPFLASILGWATAGTIWLMNYVIMEIDRWPYAVLEGLFITKTEAFLMMLLAMLLYGILALRRRTFVFPAFIVLLLFTLSVAWRDYAIGRQSSVTIYGISKHTAIHFVQGKHHIMVADTGFSNDTFQMEFNIKKNAVVHGLVSAPEWVKPDDTLSTTFMRKQGPVICAFSQTIVIWNREWAKRYTINKPLEADVLLITGNTDVKTEKMKLWFSPKLIVLDLTVPAFRAQKIKSSAEAMGIPVHDIREAGAWIWKE